MQRFRVLVLLLLVLAVPSYGFASLGTLGTPCPMQLNGASHAADADVADGMDCCGDAGMLVLQCKACSVCQDCHAASLVLPSAALRMPLPRGESLASTMVEYAPGSPGAGAVWRPPRTL